MGFDFYDSSGRASRATNSFADLPLGSMILYAGTAAPYGWLACDGSAVSRTTYADLFTAIGTNYGVGDGSTTFNLPNEDGTIIYAIPVSSRYFGTNPIGSGIINTSNIADGAVGPDQLSTPVRSGLLTNVQTTSLATAPQVTITTGNTFYDVSGLSVSITPSASASRVMILGQIDLTAATTDAYIAARLVRGSTAVGVNSSGSGPAATTGLYLGTAASVDANAHIVVPFMHVDSPAATTSTTYKIQVTANVNGTTISVNRSSAGSSYRPISNITAIEVLQ